MRLVLILSAVLTTGCQIGKDPMEHAYWALTSDGWPAFCVPDDGVRCFTPAREDRIHYIDGVCGVSTSGI